MSQNRVLEISESQLPSDPSNLLQNLAREKVPIKYWLSLALLYHRNGHISNFVKVLRFALQDKEKNLDDSNEHMFSDKKARYDTMNSLASHCFQMFECEGDPESAQRSYQEGMQLFNEMSMSMFDVQGYITRCFAFLITGQVRQAQKTLTEEETQEPLVLIAQAIISYNDGKVSSSLQLLKKVVKYNPLCPIDIWMAIGICYFKIGNLVKAKFSLEYVLEKEPQNAMAMTALGITEMRLNFSSQSNRMMAITLFQKSFEIDDQNPLTMKHLADHFFIHGDLDLAQNLCLRALKFCEKLKKAEADSPSFRRDIQPLKSDLSFILGKIFHKLEDYDSAIVHYFKAVEENSQNFSALYCLAQIHFLNGNFMAVDDCLGRVLAEPKFKHCFEAIKLLAKAK